MYSNLAKSSGRESSSTQRRGSVAISTGHQEPADNVAVIVDAPDNQPLIEKAQGGIPKHPPGEYPGHGVYGIMLQAEIPISDRLALRGQRAPGYEGD